MAQISESEIRRIAEQAIEKLGEHATKANIEKVVHETVDRLQNEKMSTPSETVKIPHQHKSGERVIVTAFGKNKIGILAGLTGCLAATNCDVIDLSQKILKEFFTIMLLIDITHSAETFESIKQKLIETGEKFDLKVVVQHEQIFKSMHRI
ncbi:MAG: ACT domain-containing protein [Calditrichae bacterium]|nr:ACT domain-containing protein [Calditrichota bacterium]MCB9058995.1 ACT domain-containing protein [Calditrichia bacterium]